MAIHLIPSPDAMVLVTNGAPTNVEHNEHILPVPSGFNNNPLINGRIYGFDPATGKRLWGAVKIHQYGLVLSQPNRLPALTFVRIVHHATQNGQPDTKTGVLCVDRRSGRIVFQDDKVLSNAINNWEEVGDPGDGTVTIMLPPTKTVTLKFTDKEVPPEAKTTKQENAAEASPAKTAAEALGKALEGVLKPLTPEKKPNNAPGK